jgi:hypothetical protein
MKGFTNIRKVSLRMILVGIAAIIVLSAVAAPADAQPTAFYQSGYPGSLAYDRTAAQCFLMSVAAGMAPELSSDSPVVTPSPYYGLPQTIERQTRIETSSDNGMTWRIWQYLPTQSGVVSTPGTGSVFYPQQVDLWPGFSYRIVEGFNFKVGNSYVGSRWYVLGPNDYFINSNSSFGYRGEPMPTQFSAGCTIPSS